MRIRAKTEPTILTEASQRVSSALVLTVIPAAFQPLYRVVERFRVNENHETLRQELRKAAVRPYALEQLKLPPDPEATPL